MTIVAKIDPLRIAPPPGGGEGQGRSDVHYEHFRYYCTTLEQFPAIDIEVRDGRIVALTDYRVIQAAIDLGRPEVVVVCWGAEESSKQTITRLGGHIVDYHQALSYEPEEAVHVINFEHELTEAGVEQLRATVQIHFERTTKSGVWEWKYSQLHRRCEFRAKIPLYDGHGADLMDLLRFIHTKYCRIVSYQGKRFVP